MKVEPDQGSKDDSSVNGIAMYYRGPGFKGMLWELHTIKTVAMDWSYVAGDRILQLYCWNSKLFKVFINELAIIKRGPRYFVGTEYSLSHIKEVAMYHKGTCFADLLLEIRHYLKPCSNAVVMYYKRPSLFWKLYNC